jgi:hypothetical protein
MNPPMNEVTSLSQFTRLRQPLSIGDVVSVGLAIAKQRWPLFCGIALRSIAWLVIPLVGVIFGTAFLTTMSSSSSQVSNIGAGVLLFVIWLVVALFCFGKYLANAGLISRIVFNDLSQRSETVQEAARVTRSLTWSYLGASVLYLVIFISAALILSVVFSVIASLLILMFAGVLGGLSGSMVGRGDPVMVGTLSVIVVILMVLLLLGYVTALVWVMARFFFSEVPLSVEPKIGGIGAIGRSWELSKRSGWRLMTITTVGFLVTFPITTLGQLIVALPLLAVQLGESASDGATSSVWATGLSSLLNLISTLVVTLLTMGFWQAVKAVVYFDLLNCREGNALELQER